MSTNWVLLDHPQKNIARISLNRPEKHNAFNAELIAELKNTFMECASDETTRVVILTAHGANFSAGADLEWMQQMVNATKEENRQDALALADLMWQINNFPKPTIAAINGAVLGGAIGLICCCDVAIANENAYFCFSEVRIGLIPAVISPYIINAIGERQTRRYFLTAEKIDAIKAQHIGLIHEYVAEEKLEYYVMNLAGNVIRNSPAALKQSKHLIQHVSHHVLDENLKHYTAETIANIRISKEGQEGLKAYLEKREPRW